jgi:hypothetical protein
MMEDPWYADVAYGRWDELRSSVLSWENVENIIDSCVTLMGPAIDRNYKRWPTLGTYVWPNVVWPDTYEEEITMLKTFITDRLPWMDSQWSGKGSYSDYPPYLECREDQYLEATVRDTYIAMGDELDPTYTWDDFDIETVSNNINGKKTLENVSIQDGTNIIWTVTDSKGQTAECSFNVYVNPTNLDKYDALSFRTYPNPASDYFNIESNFPVKEIIVQSMDGKIVERVVAGDERQIRISTSTYLNGAYLVNVIGENGYRVCKLLMISK